MKNTFARLIIAAALIFCCQATFAQSGTMSPTRLPLVEQEMFAKGNPNFIVVDLLIDGLLQPGQNCKFVYKKGKISFQGNKLPAAMEQKYQSRMNEFLAAHPTSPFIIVDAKQVSMDQVLDPSSPFRTTPPVSGQNASTTGLSNSKF